MTETARPARICVVGAGRSGAVAAACLAEMGHYVCALDIDAARIASFCNGSAPFHEPGLDELVRSKLDSGHLLFTTEAGEAVPQADFVILAVPTPAARDGRSNLSALFGAARELLPLMADDAVLVTRSTVPVGTNAQLAAMVRAERPESAIEVLSNPEFLREGHAVQDFLEPERVVIGSNPANSAGARALARIYEPLDCPIIVADLQTAEMAKYAANAYLASSISFMNEIANICERTGADVTVVSKALALDRRIGKHAYLAPGIGYGGSCLPKDLSALVHTAQDNGYTPPMLRAIAEVNELQPVRVLSFLNEVYGSVAGLYVAVLGMSFKGDTFDARTSPALSVIKLLAQAGAHVRAYDPFADESAPKYAGQAAQLVADAYSAVEGCHALVVATEHSAFRSLDLARLGDAMAARVLIDGRNVIDPEAAAEAGFSYIGIGRARRGD